MCQLTLVDTKDKTVNRAMMLSMLSINSITDADGFGIQNTNGLYIKSGEPAHNFISLDKEDQIGKALNYNYAGIAHCRLATIKSTVKTSKAHPFVTDHISLMHNGSVRDHDIPENLKRVLNKYKNLIDTERVVVLLDHIMREFFKGKFSYKAVEKTMKYFNGAFNFFIRASSDPDRIHIFKGHGRPLVGVELVDGRGTPVGTIINSRSPQLSAALLALSGMKPSWTVKRIVDFTDNVYYTYLYDSYFVKQESQFKYDHNKHKGYYPYAHGSTNYSTHANNALAGENDKKITTTTKVDNNAVGVSAHAALSDAVSVLKMCDQVGLTLEELDILSSMLLGKSILSVNDEDVSLLIEGLTYIVEDAATRIDSVLSNRERRGFIHGLDRTIEAYKGELTFPFALHKEVEK